MRRTILASLIRSSLPPLTALAALFFTLARVPLLKFESPLLALVLLSAWLYGAGGGLLATVTRLVGLSLFFFIPEPSRHTMRVTEPGQIRLYVWNSGVGLPILMPTGKRQSLGMQLAPDLARQLRGSVVIDGSTGTSIAITFPFAALRAVRAPGAEGLLL